MRAIFTSSGAPEVTCSRSPDPRLVGDIRRRRIILGLALQNTRSALEIDPIAWAIGSAETEYDTGKYVAQRGNGCNLQPSRHTSTLQYPALRSTVGRPRSARRTAGLPRPRMQPAPAPATPESRAEQGAAARDWRRTECRP